MSPRGIFHNQSVAMPIRGNKQTANAHHAQAASTEPNDQVIYKLPATKGNPAAAPMLPADRSCGPRPSQPGTFDRVGLQAGCRVAGLILRWG